VAPSHRRQYVVLQCRPCFGLGRTRIRLNVLVVHRAAPRILLCRQIVDLPFQVAGHDLGEAPHCVAPELPPSSQIRAWAGPPTNFGHNRHPCLQSACTGAAVNQAGACWATGSSECRCDGRERHFGGGEHGCGGGRGRWSAGRRPHGICYGALVVELPRPGFEK